MANNLKFDFSLFIRLIGFCSQRTFALCSDCKDPKLKSFAGVTTPELGGVQAVVTSHSNSEGGLWNGLAAFPASV